MAGGRQLFLMSHSEVVVPGRTKSTQIPASSNPRVSSEVISKAGQKVAVKELLQAATLRNSRRLAKD